MPDPGSPHTHPEDYAAFGLDFERDNAAIPEHRGPAQDPAKDTEIEQKVCRLLEQNQFVEDRRIQVNSHDGAVTLNGIAENRFARERAEQLAAETEGVQSVDNRIRVQNQEDAAGGPVLTVQDPEQGGTDPSTQRS